MTTLLLVSAALLGLLAFFEPCTIATHTLFSVRAHQQAGRHCCQNLLTVWLSRVVLLILLFVIIVLVTEPPVWGGYLPSIILSAIALVYIASRFMYIPIPHLEFFRLLPAGKSLPFAVQLGMTLPACTIPLFAIVAGIAASVDSVAFAALAGLLFGSLFTLPMAVSSWLGLHESGLELLNRTARASPYLTAVLLFGAALYLLVALIQTCSRQRFNTPAGQGSDSVF